MYLKTPNGPYDTGHEHQQKTLKLDLAALKRWLTAEVTNECISYRAFT